MFGNNDGGFGGIGDFGGFNSNNTNLLGNTNTNLFGTSNNSGGFGGIGDFGGFNSNNTNLLGNTNTNLFGTSNNSGGFSGIGDFGGFNSNNTNLFGNSINNNLFGTSSRVDDLMKSFEDPLQTKPFSLNNDNIMLGQNKNSHPGGINYDNPEGYRYNSLPMNSAGFDHKAKIDSEIRSQNIGEFGKEEYIKQYLEHNCANYNLNDLSDMSKLRQDIRNAGEGFDSRRKTLGELGDTLIDQGKNCLKGGVTGVVLGSVTRTKEGVILGGITGCLEKMINNTLDKK